MSHRLTLAAVATACICSVIPAKAQEGANNVLVLNGAGDYLAATSLPTVANDFTIEAWVNPVLPHEIDTESTSGYAGMKGQCYVLAPVHGTFCWGAGHAGAGISVGTNGISVYEHAGDYFPALLVYRAPISGWTHVAVVYTDRRPSLYVNGLLVATGLRSPMNYVHPSAGRMPMPGASGNPYILGGIGGGVYGNFFRGKIDDFRVWGRALGANEVSEAMKGNKPGDGRGLLIDFDMNRRGAGAGLEVANVAGASRRGTVLSAGTPVPEAHTLGSATTPYFSPREVSNGPMAVVDTVRLPQIPIGKFLPPVTIDGSSTAITFNVALSTPDLEQTAPGETTGIRLEQNVPNPFSDRTLISYRIATPGHVTLRLYDAGGRPVATVVDEEQIAGTHDVVVGADQVPASGGYFYRLTLDNRTVTQSMSVVK